MAVSRAAHRSDDHQALEARAAAGVLAAFDPVAIHIATSPDCLGGPWGSPKAAGSYRRRL